MNTVTLRHQLARIPALSIVGIESKFGASYWDDPRHANGGGVLLPVEGIQTRWPENSTELREIRPCGGICLAPSPSIPRN